MNHTNFKSGKSLILLLFISGILTCACSRGFEPPEKKDVLSDAAFNWQKDTTEHFDDPNIDYEQKISAAINNKPTL